MACKYIISYISAVTGNTRTSGCANKKAANKEAAALEKEGCKNVRVFPFTPVRIN